AFDPGSQRVVVDAGRGVLRLRDRRRAELRVFAAPARSDDHHAGEARDEPAQRTTPICSTSIWTRSCRPGAASIVPNASPTADTLNSPNRKRRGRAARAAYTPRVL